jgi:DNA repair exonuclease SbcCD ATPase subunit
MDIQFAEIEIKNFLSFGNNLQKLSYKPGLYLVQGYNKQDPASKNGAGKSTLMIDALMWGLFGKTVKKLVKKGIINSINNKECEVNVNFSIGNKNYRIERGMKPDYVKFYDPDYPKYPEPIECSKMALTQDKINQVLGAGSETYKNLLIMCANYVTSFLELKADQRRKILEDILGVTVIGEMNEKNSSVVKSLKKDVETSREHLLVLNNSIEALDEQHLLIKQKSEEFEKNKTDRLRRIKAKFEEKKSIYLDLGEQVKKSEEHKDKLDKLKETKTKYEKVVNEIQAKINHNTKEIPVIEKKMTRLKKNPTCMECGTPTDAEHIKNHISSEENKITNLETENAQLEKKSLGLTEKLKVVTTKQNKLETLLHTGASAKLRMSSVKTEMQELKEESTEVKAEKNNFNIDESEDKITSMKEDYAKRETIHKNNEEDKEYHEYIKKILSDKGVKTYIIKKVLPFLNKKVNTYLSKLNLNVVVEFDSNLDEHIKSRNRDHFKYDNFSGGEKKRIDSSLLFTLHDLANIQNTINSNLLILDEILDSALDANGIADMLAILKDKAVKEGKSIYVISHRDNIDLELFDDVIAVHKDEDFTIIN